jgi:hypothetical protein
LPTHGTERHSTAGTRRNLPQAAEVLNAVRAWRGWSDVDASIHYAFYELPDLKPVPVILDSLKALIADFDRVWGTRVTRTREIIDTKQLISKPELKEASETHEHPRIIPRPRRRGD